MLYVILVLHSVVFDHWPGTATEDTASGWHSVSTFTCWKALLGGDWRCLKSEEWVRAHTHTHNKYLQYVRTHLQSLRSTHSPNCLARPLAFTVRGEILMAVRCCEQWSRNWDQQAATSAASPHAQAPSLNHNDLTQLRAFKNYRASKWLKNAN